MSILDNKFEGFNANKFNLRRNKMTKTKYNKQPLIYPMPAVVVGAAVDGRPNFVTLGNCGILCTSPAVIYISTDKSHHTNKGIKENLAFSINIPSADLAAKVDYCGLVSGRNTDKLKVFECFYGSGDKIPMINYSMDRSYWQFGDFVDKAFKAGNSYRDLNEINIF